MCVCFDLVKLCVCDVPRAPGFLKALHTLARVLEGCVTPFPAFIEDMGEQSLLPVCTHFGGLAANVHVFPDVYWCDGINRHVRKHLNQVC